MRPFIQRLEHQGTILTGECAQANLWDVKRTAMTQAVEMALARLAAKGLMPKASDF